MFKMIARHEFFLFSIRRNIVVSMLIFLLFHFSMAENDINRLKFKYLSTKDGLSHDNVIDIIQDKQGFIWIATIDGLNHFNGHSFSVFRYKSYEPSSIVGSAVTSLCEDRDGNIWIGTDGMGISILNPQTGQFSSYKQIPGDNESLINNKIISLYSDKIGRIWIGTNQGKFYWFDHESNSFKLPQTESMLKSGIGKRIFCFVEDKEGFIWIGSDEGIVKFESRTGRFSEIHEVISRGIEGKNKRVFDIKMDSDGNFWIGFWNEIMCYNPQLKTIIQYPLFANFPDVDIPSLYLNLLVDTSGNIWCTRGPGGLYLVDSDSQQVLHYDHKSTDEYALNNICLKSINEDISGLIWIGTCDGIFILDERRSEIEHFRNKPNDTNSLSLNSINAICEGNGYIWFGSNLGLDRYNPESRTFKRYRMAPDKSGEIFAVSAILADTENQLWIGSWGSGLNVMNMKTEEFSFYSNDPGDPNSLSNNTITSLYMDKKDRIWVGTDGGGLNLYNHLTDKFIRITQDSSRQNSLSSDSVTHIEEDKYGNMWVATWGGGICKFDGEKDHFIRYVNQPDDPGSIGIDFITYLMTDNSGNMWIGTYGSGLDMYNPSSNTFTHYTTQEGLPSDNISGLCQDNNGDIWISTFSGLARFDINTKTFSIFNQSDGLQSSYSIIRSCMIQNGELYFGGRNGVSAFYPDTLQISDFMPSVRFTSLKIVKENKRRDYFINPSTVIHLSYRDSFNVTFAALDYYNPDKHQYAYMLEGADSEWNNIGNKNDITFAGLDSGSYKLKIKGTNRDGIWSSNENAIAIHVSPPWWGTWWFRTMLILISAILVYNWYRNRMKRLAHQIRTDAQIEHFCEKFKISEREIDIIKLILKGKSRSDIADKIYLSESTVKNHIYSLYQKLGIRNRAQLLDLFKFLNQ